MATFQISPWAPFNETAHDLYIERTFFDGLHVATLALGAQTVITFMAVKALLRLPRSQRLFSYGLLAYTIVSFCLGVVGHASNIKVAELAFVENREHPGGPIGVFGESATFKINKAGFVCYALVTWMQDGFLLYRFMVIFDWVRAVILLPCLVYLFSITSSIMLAYQVVGGHQPSTAVNFAVMFWSASITTTVLLTLLIVGKLILLRHQLRKAFNTVNVLRVPYLSISAMLVESALLYSLLAMAFLILFVKNDPFQNIVFPVLSQASIMAPQLIILRVAEGRSFTSAIIQSSLDCSPANVAKDAHNLKRRGNADTYPSTIAYAVNDEATESHDQGDELRDKIPTLATFEKEADGIV